MAFGRFVNDKATLDQILISEVGWKDVNPAEHRQHSGAEVQRRLPVMTLELT